MPFPLRLRAEELKFRRHFLKNRGVVRMIKAAVVEDNNSIRKRICELIERETAQAEEVVQILPYADAKSFLEDLTKENTEGMVDILFCDIELEGMNGIELGQIIRKQYPGIYLVYVTSHSKYAIESYIIEAHQYILKSDMERRLPEILRKLLEEVRNGGKKYRIVSTMEGQEKIFYVEIIYIYKEKGSKYVRYVTTRGTFRERINMKDLIGEMSGREFILAERGYMINMDHVTGIKGNRISLSEGHQIIVSRGRVMDVKEKLNLYWGS